MNYYDIRPADFSRPSCTYCGVDAEAALRLFCWDHAYDRDEVDEADLHISRIDVTDLDDDARDVVASRLDRYKAAQVTASVDEENNNEAWWASCPAPIAERLRTESVCVLSLDELFGLMTLPGWYSEGNEHAPYPLTWSVVRW
jgi:hypothetical protein